MAEQYGNQSKSFLSDLVKLGSNSFKSFGYQKITVTGSVSTLTIPAGAKYALVSVESSVTSGVVVRALQNLSSTVSTTLGIGYRDASVFDITDAQNLAGFQITQAQAGTHNIYVEYYR